MKVQSNLRAGKGGASGVGKNSSTTKSVEVEAPEVISVPVARCVGI